MDTWIIAVTVGAALFILGAMMMRSHVLIWRVEKNDPEIDDDDRKYYYRRYRRRMQTSATIAALGFLIAFGDAVVPRLFADANKDFQMKVFAVYWGTVLLLTVWVIFLGMSDMLSTSAHSRAALSRIRAKQRELEQEIAEIRRRKSNGRQDFN